MATTRTDYRNEALDPEAIHQLFASVGQASRDVSTRASQPTSVAAPKLGRPLPSRDSSRPTRCRLSQAEYADKVRLWRDWLPTVWLVGCLLVAGFCFLMGMPDSPLRKTTVGAAVAKYVEQPRLRTRDIQDFDVGMRSAGTNPLRHQVETAPEPDPETSRKLVLRMKKESGRLLLVKLLRSLEWIEAVGAEEGGAFSLDLPEMGAVGDAYVEAVLPCPPIEDGPGNVVTGVFAHEADPDTVILSVAFANGAHVKGVTDNHPFFSVSENDFGEIGQMREGDYVKVNDGVTHITKIES